MDEETLKSLETLNHCIALLNQRCAVMQEHIALLQAKINEVLETT